MQREQEHRRFQRTKEYGPRKLAVSFKTGSSLTGSCEAKLCDFSEGGIGMESPRPFETGQVLQIEGELKGSSYSMHLTATAQVIYCRLINREAYRVGVSFIDVSYRPVLG